MKDKRKWLVVGGRWPAIAGHQPPAHGDQPNNESGFTLLELIITLTIISILVTGIVPIANNVIKREKERELRRNLREIRMAIDAYHRECMGWSPLVHSHPSVANGETDPDLKCYPKDLQTLRDGVRPPNAIDTKRFLRRIPKDPFARPEDDPKDHWEPIPAGGSGSHVFDVRSKQGGTALDGTNYRDW